MQPEIYKELERKFLTDERRNRDSNQRNNRKKFEQRNYPPNQYVYFKSEKKRIKLIKHCITEIFINFKKNTMKKIFIIVGLAGLEVIKPIKTKYDYAFEIFDSLNPYKVDLQQAEKLLGAIKDAKFEYDYSSQYGLLNDFIKNKCIKKIRLNAMKKIIFCTLFMPSVFLTAQSFSNKVYTTIYEATSEGATIQIKVKEFNTDDDPKEYRTKLGVCGFTPRIYAYTNSGVKTQNICVVRYIDCLYSNNDENGETYIVDLYGNEIKDNTFGNATLNKFSNLVRSNVCTHE